MNNATLTKSNALLDRCVGKPIGPELRAEIIAFRNRRPGRQRKADVAEIARLRAAGNTTAQIANATGLSRSSVLRAGRDP